VAQARCLAERLSRCDLSGFAGVASPYGRTAHTAAEVARATGLRFATEELVREWGVAATVAGRYYPAETTGELAARLGEFLRRYAGRKLVVVSHAAPIAVLTQMVRGEAPTTEGRFWGGVGNCCPRWLRAGGSPDALR
jgi:broad specificity phosphatase PhoE